MRDFSCGCCRSCRAFLLWTLQDQRGQARFSTERIRGNRRVFLMETEQACWLNAQRSWEDFTHRLFLQVFGTTYSRQDRSGSHCLHAKGRGLGLGPWGLRPSFCWVSSSCASADSISSGVGSRRSRRVSCFVIRSRARRSSRRMVFCSLPQYSTTFYRSTGTIASGQSGPKWVITACRWRR